MKSARRGKRTSDVEVQNISRNGIWLLVRGKEYFLPHKQYPWFERARIADIYKVKLLHGFHLHWPELDVDLEIDSLIHPEKYPLVSKKVPSQSRQATSTTHHYQ